MQQQELAQMRQRDANLTALAAIGPRKKRKVDCPGPGSGAEVQQCCGIKVLGSHGEHLRATSSRGRTHTGEFAFSPFTCCLTCSGIFVLHLTF